MTEPLFWPLASSFIILGAESTQPFRNGDTKVNATVLQCFPVEERESDVVNSTTMFCMPEGVEAHETPQEPEFFANTLTMGNGDRNYLFCLKFTERVDLNAPSQKQAKPLVRAQSVRDAKEMLLKDHWETAERSSTGNIYHSQPRHPFAGSAGPALFNMYKSTPTVLSTEKVEESKNPEDSDIRHPLGALGVCLEEQLKFGAQLRESHGSDPGELSSDSTDYCRSSLSSLSILQNKSEKRKKITLERCNSSGNYDEITSKLRFEEHAKAGVIFANKAIVISSKFPYINFFKNYLSQIYEYLICRKDGTHDIIPIEKFISNLLYEVIVPPPGNDLCVVVGGPVEPLFLCNPSVDGLPLMDVSLEPLLTALDRESLITIFIGLSLEKKFLFISSDSSLLYHTTHCLLSLLYPFEWETGYVPLVPENLLELTQAISPIVLGVQAQYTHLLDVPEDMIIVDIDKSVVQISPSNALPELPEQIYENLQRFLKKAIFSTTVRDLKTVKLTSEKETLQRIQQNRKRRDTQVRLCFLGYFVSLFSGIQKYINAELGDTEDVFDIHFYLNSQVQANREFWHALLSTRMFEIFTQKLANVDDTASSLGLFTKLSVQSTALTSVREIFQLALSQNVTPTIPELKIFLHDPKSEPLVTRELHNWNLPPLDPQLCCISPTHFEDALANIKQVLKQSQIPQLYLLRCHLLMQQFHHQKNIKHAHAALCDIVVAMELDSSCTTARYVSSLLELFPDKDLKKIISSKATGRIVKETKEILDSRADSVPNMFAGEDAEDDSSEVESDSEENCHFGGIRSEIFRFDVTADTTMMENYLGAIKQLKLQSDKDVCYRSLLKTLENAHLVPDDAITKKKLVKILHRKKDGKIPRRYLQAFLKAMEVVIQALYTLQVKNQAIIGADTRILFSTSASLRNGHKGKLILTHQDLLFISKDKVCRSIPLSDIQLVEADSYHKVFSGGLPGIKIVASGKEHFYLIKNTWNATHLRDIWIRFISDLASAWDMAHYLRQPNIITIAVQNIILSSTMGKTYGKRVPPGVFQYFGECFPGRRWFNIPHVFQARGLLNIHHVCELQEISNQNQSTLEMLQLGLHLLHVFRTDDAKDPEKFVNFAELKESEDFSKFSKLTCQLQRFNMNNLSPEETTVLFINIYNILVLHAYMILERFPASEWEWRYMEKEAYYTIGGVAYSLWDIYHGILRRNKPTRWVQEVPFVDNDPRMAMVKRVIEEPRLIFAVTNHTTTSPAVFRLEPSSIVRGIEQATNLFCQNTISIVGHSVSIPALFKDLYSDFFPGEFSQNNVLTFIKKHSSQMQRKQLERIQSLPEFEVEWIRNYTPSPKVLVGYV